MRKMRRRTAAQSLVPWDEARLGAWNWPQHILRSRTASTRRMRWATVVGGSQRVRIRRNRDEEIQPGPGGKTVSSKEGRIQTGHGIHFAIRCSQGCRPVGDGGQILHFNLGNTDPAREVNSQIPRPILHPPWRHSTQVVGNTTTTR